MSVLSTLYASGGAAVIHDTLQIDIGPVRHLLTRGWEDIAVVTEAGAALTFTACGMDVAVPARNADGTQDLNFALTNIDGVVSAAIREALKNKQEIRVTYRKYISTDLAAPAERPYTLKVKSGQWSATEVQITAGYMNILDTAWPRERYTLSKQPGLRYFS
ncbi:DUF1833 family protein [Stenotrophomonas sp. NPDC078853]|uniref:DUF1833 family protein n=1 Tax=Stenotrophomonas sp. NPDC078853 TaxID=3364534 RepID=UPI003850EDFB